MHAWLGEMASVKLHTNFDDALNKNQNQIPRTKWIIPYEHLGVIFVVLTV